MPAWSRTTKPSADKTIAAEKVVGADRNEVAATPGVAAPGWVVDRSVGNRKRIEVLVAMKTPPTENNDDDTILPDVRIVIGTQPQAVTIVEGEDAVFTVAATTIPTGQTITYQWSTSTNDGANWSNTGTNSDTLTVAAAALSADGDLFRCTLTGPVNTGTLTVVSQTALLTVTEAE